MIWWFVILAFGAGAVLWAGVSVYLRVKSHMAGAASPPVASSLKGNADAARNE
jgi:hypothetical protein